MIKKVSKVEKEKFVESFVGGMKIKEISKMYGFTITTITRQLKMIIGEDQFSQIKNSSSNHVEKNLKKNSNLEENHLINQAIDLNFDNQSLNLETNIINNPIYESKDEFFEIAPLKERVELENQKEISSISINHIEFPKLLFMVVDENIELEIKLLKDYPEWQFLPKNDLNRKTIQIFFDIKNAKRSCTKKQKVIKVPNTDVFRIVSPLLLRRGVTRLVSEENLISL